MGCPPVSSVGTVCDMAETEIIRLSRVIVIFLIALVVFKYDALLYIISVSGTRTLRFNV